MNEITHTILAQASTQVSNTSPEGKIRDMIDYIQSFFDKAQPDITVPLIIVAIVIIGFILGWFRGFFRNIIVLVAIFVGLGIGIFLAPQILNKIAVSIMHRVGLEVDNYKPALELGIKLMLPIVMLVSSFITYSISGSILTLIRIFRKVKRPKKSLKAMLLSGTLNGGLGAIAFLPGAFLASNLINISRDSDNKFTNDILNPAIKVISFGKGIGLGKNINELKELFAESSLVYSFFENPKSVPVEDRKRIIDKTIDVLNNPDISPTITTSIVNYIKSKVDSLDVGEHKKTITNDNIKKALSANIDAIKLDNTPVTKYIDELNITDKLNEHGKESLHKIIGDSINIYSEKGTDENLKKELSKKIFDELIKRSPKVKTA